MLFILVLENLSQELHAAEESGSIDTYIISGAKSPTHLMFVDDILLFTRENLKSMSTIAREINKFSSFSGLQVNSLKVQ